ncbi:MAG: hypothetical protein AB1489_18025 [Acidobacteriota bacterium]
MTETRKAGIAAISSAILYRLTQGKTLNGSFYFSLGYFSITLLSLLPYTWSDYCYVDELTLMVDSKRMLLGDQQYRDYLTHYGMGSVYLIALVWRITGIVSHIPIRLLTFLAITLGGWLLILIARYFTGRHWLSLLPAIVFANFHSHLFPFINHHWFASLVSILYLFLVVRYLHSLCLKDLYYCGLAAGLSLLFIMHEGVVNIFVGILIVIIVALLIGERLDNCRLSKLATTYFAGLLTLLLPVFIYYIATGAFDDYLENVFIWSLTKYLTPGANNNIPWADINNLHLWRSEPSRMVMFFTTCSVLLLLLLPLIVLLMAVVLLTSPSSIDKHFRFTPTVELAKRLTGAGVVVEQRYYYLVMLVLTLYAIGLYLTPVLSQASFYKLLWGSLPALILAVIFWERGLTAVTAIPGIRRALAAVMIFIFISLGIVTVARLSRVLEGNNRELYFDDESTNFSNHPIIELINRETTPDDYFFAYKRLALLFYMVETRLATRYTFNDGGVENTLTQAQLKELVNDLYRQRPKFMVFSGEAELLELVQGNSDFPQWLNNNYFLRLKIEGLLLYQRK